MTQNIEDGRCLKEAKLAKLVVKLGDESLEFDIPVDALEREDIDQVLYAMIAQMPETSSEEREHLIRKWIIEFDKIEDEEEEADPSCASILTEPRSIQYK